MIILGIDLGKARTGVAICDKGELLASPLTVSYTHLTLPTTPYV